MAASVNVPTNTKIKEKDINTKLQLYGIYSAFANGKVPSNKQIDVAMNSALASRALASPSKELSAEGRLLVSDLRDVIEKSKVLLLTKNEGNLIQDFVYQCMNISSGDASKPNAPIDKDTAKQHGNEALDGLRTLAQLLISNGQFRKLLNDGLVLLRDMAGDGAQKIAHKVNPDEDALNNIDAPAEDNTWHDVPDLSVGNLKSQAKSAIDKNKPMSSGQAKDKMSATADDAQNNDPKAVASNVKDQALSNVSQEDKDAAKDKAQQAKERTKNYLTDKMPKERREQTIWRLKKMVVEIQGHSDYQRAIDTLLRLAEEYTGHTKNMTSQTTGAVKGAHTDDGLKNAEADLKVLIERFANSTSTDDLFDSLNQIYSDADKDPELKGWFRHIDSYVRKCLKEQGFILTDSADREWDKLYDQGNFLLRERYRNHTDRIVDETKFLADQFDSDPQNKAFAASMNKLFNDLGNDENGKPTFKPHLIKDLSQVIIPGIFENIRYVPIPRIEYSDPMVDAIIENLVIEGDNLAPNMFEFSSDNHFQWGRKQFHSKNKNKVMMSVSGIQCDLKDVSYYIKKKQGFPGITDKGVMDIFLGGTGFSFKAAMETADASDKNHFFKVNSVVVDVKHMNIKLKKSSFKIIFALVRPLLLRVMKPILQKVLQKLIKDKINELDSFCHEIYLEAQKTKNEANQRAKNAESPEEAANVYQRYFNAAQTRYTQGKEKTKAKADETSADKQVNVAVTQHDSIFKNVKLPGGISTKATEYKELAAKGDKWESPVFSLGSAKETSNLPKAAQVARKPHSATQAVLQPKSNGTNGVANASSGLSNYMDSAFESSTDASATGATGASATRTTGVMPSTGMNTGMNTGMTSGLSSTHTTLGASNPVISGNV